MHSDVVSQKHHLDICVHAFFLQNYHIHMQIGISMRYSGRLAILHNSKGKRRSPRIQMMDVISRKKGKQFPKNK